MNIVNAIMTSIDSLKRRVVQLTDFGKNVKTAFQAGSYGDDSSPIKNMVAVYGETTQLGRNVVIGYINRNQLAAAGEKRIFSTDSSGNVKYYIWLHNDGTCEFGGTGDNLVRFSNLQTAFNQLKSDFNTFIAAYNLHTHVGVTVGAGATGITTPGTSSSADISGAKVTEMITGTT